MKNKILPILLGIIMIARGIIGLSSESKGIPPIIFIILGIVTVIVGFFSKPKNT